MSHYKSYPAYKDSGIQWLGKLPEHWARCALKWRAERFAGGTPDKSNSEYWADGTIPWLASGEVNQKLITEPTTYITESAYKNSSAKWIPSSALVMALAGQGKTRGTVAQLAIKSTCNQSMAAIIPKSIDARFLYWWLDSNYSNLRGLSGDDVRDGLNLEVIGQIPCPLPHADEQKVIAAHLDTETTRIDALITKKTRFIELLREKRQALITNAVTKGLDPNVKMKDSGVAWLGEVPEHWVVRPVKFLTKQKAGAIKTGPFGSQLTSAEMLSGAIKVYNQRNVIDNDLAAGDSYITIEKFQQLASFEVFAEDVLVTTRGTIGRVSVAPANLERGILHPCLMRIQVDKKIMSVDFFAMLLGDSHILQAQISYMSNASTIEVIYSETMGSLTLPTPPIGEQEKICDYVKCELDKFSKLVKKTERSIELLKERRSALITAAVTGQIDLREAA